MVASMNNVLGGGDIWCPNADGTTQEISLASGATSVQFTGVPYNSAFGYDLWLDSAFSATANTDPPKQLGRPVFGTPSGGKMTVTFNFASAVTAAQAGCRATLRILR